MFESSTDIDVLLDGCPCRVEAFSSDESFLVFMYEVLAYIEVGFGSITCLAPSS